MVFLEIGFRCASAEHCITSCHYDCEVLCIAKVLFLHVLLQIDHELEATTNFIDTLRRLVGYSGKRRVFFCFVKFTPPLLERDAHIHINANMVVTSCWTHPTSRNQCYALD